MITASHPDTAIASLSVAAYRVPIDYAEADGTYAWDHTILVLVEVTAGGQTGLGYSYADLATAHLIHASLASVIHGRDALDIPGTWAGWSR
jgi:hypothetical protein